MDGLGKKKILILSNVTHDLLSMRREVVQALLGHGYDVSICAILGEGAQEFSRMGCHMVDSPLDRRGTNPLSDFRLLLHFLRLLRGLKPDLVLTYTIKPNLYGGIACTLRHVPYLSNVTGLGSAETLPAPLKAVARLLYRLGLAHSSCVFYQNQDDLGKVNALLGRKDRFQLLPGSGVNTSHFALQEYPCGGPVNFLYISRIMKEKGIDQYLAAAEAIKGRHPDTSFHIVGSCEEDYRGVLAEYGRRGVVQYHGAQKDVRAFHAFSHCTIHPTYYAEGLSNVLLESASSGRPAITTDRPGTREAVDHGATGFLFRERDTGGLVGRIEEFLALDDRQRREMGLKARAKAVNGFERQIVVGKYLEAIADTLHQTGGNNG
jgi:galacturonosyltransferase